MKHKIKNASAALLAILVLLIVGIISMLEIVPIEKQKYFENVSNIIMLTVAVIGFFLPDSLSSANTERNFGMVCSDIMVSGISFLMNINVFGHEFHFEQPVKSIFGWHVCWIICIIVQVLVLLGLGKNLLAMIKMILLFIINVCKEMGSLLSDIWNTIRNCSQRMLLVIFFGFFVWSIYGGTLCYGRGVQTVFSDIDFWGNSVLLWMNYFIIIFLIYIIEPISQKVKMLILGTNGKATLGIALVIMLAVMSIWIPSLIQTVAIIIFIPVVATVLLWCIVKKIHGGNGSGSNDSPNINLRYVSVILVLFILIPLIIIFGGTFLWAEGSDIIGKDPASINSWLEFLNAAAGIAKELIEILI